MEKRIWHRIDVIASIDTRDVKKTIEYGIYYCDIDKTYRWAEVHEGWRFVRKSDVFNNRKECEDEAKAAWEKTKQS